MPMIFRIVLHWFLFSVFVFSLLCGCASRDKSPLEITANPKISTVNQRAAHDALLLQGHPYVFGGESPAIGFDCSGLVVYVYHRLGLYLPRDTESLARQLPSVSPLQRQPGDLVFFNTNGKPFSHVGIYVGDQRFVHAPSQRTGKVMTSSLDQPYWKERFMAVRRPNLQHSLLWLENPLQCPLT